MVFDVEDEDFPGGPVRVGGDAPGEEVEGIGGVPGDDGDVVCAGAHMLTDACARCFVQCGGYLGEVSGASVHGGVQREDLVDPFLDGD